MSKWGVDWVFFLELLNGLSTEQTLNVKNLATNQEAKKLAWALKGFIFKMLHLHVAKVPGPPK